MAMLGVLRRRSSRLCLAAPLYAHTSRTPIRSARTSTGRRSWTARRCRSCARRPAGSASASTPIGPTWDPHHYFLGADNQGRDVAARLLYGGRNSLLIGFFAALITCLRRHR